MQSRRELLLDLDIFFKIIRKKFASIKKARIFTLSNNNNNKIIMKVTATKNEGFKIATFTWNDELTECNHTAIDINDKEFQELMNNKVHEGSDLEGWTVKVEL